MTYQEYKSKRQAEFDALPIFFAFSDRQMVEALNKRGLTAEDTDKICRITSGGFALKSDLPAIRAFLDAPDPLPELMKDPTFAQGAFEYEMGNHEYFINAQGDWDVCRCFGDCEYVDGKTGPDYLREMGYGAEICDAYKKAVRAHSRAAEENGWY